MSSEPLAKNTSRNSANKRATNAQHARAALHIVLDT
jgi:hypothetical protein